MKAFAAPTFAAKKKKETKRKKRRNKIKYNKRKKNKRGICISAGVSETEAFILFNRNNNAQN